MIDLFLIANHRTTSNESLLSRVLILLKILEVELELFPNQNQVTPERNNIVGGSIHKKFTPHCHHLRNMYVLKFFIKFQTYVENQNLILLFARLSSICHVRGEHMPSINTVTHLANWQLAIAFFSFEKRINLL